MALMNTDHSPSKKDVLLARIGIKRVAPEREPAPSFADLRRAQSSSSFRLRRVLVVLATVVVAVVIPFTTVVTLGHVETSSMSPTLPCSDSSRSYCTSDSNAYYLSERITYRFRAPKVDEIVSFSYSASMTNACVEAGFDDDARTAAINTAVKRVVAVAGQTVAIRAGVLYRDGVAVNESYLLSPEEQLIDPRYRTRMLRNIKYGTPAMRQAARDFVRDQMRQADFKPVHVPEGYVFVLGDNRHADSACDSRFYGPIPNEAVKARIVPATISPFTAFFNVLR